VRSERFEPPTSDSKTEGMQIRQSSFCWHELGTGFDQSTQSFNPYKSDRMDFVPPVLQVSDVGPSDAHMVSKHVGRVDLL
jgi:hypothetical protein